MTAQDRLAERACRRDEFLIAAPCTNHTPSTPDGFTIIQAETRIIGLSFAIVRDVTGAQQTCRSAIDAQHAADRAVEALRGRLDA